MIFVPYVYETSARIVRAEDGNTDVIYAIVRGKQGDQAVDVAITFNAEQAAVIGEQLRRYGHQIGW